MRRIVIVLATVMTVVFLAMIAQSVIDGPDAGWNGSFRARGATSNVGLLLTGLCFAAVAAYWAVRNWNRQSDVLDAPKKRGRRRR